MRGLQRESGFGESFQPTVRPATSEPGRDERPAPSPIKDDRDAFFKGKQGGTVNVKFAPAQNVQGRFYCK